MADEQEKKEQAKPPKPERAEAKAAKPEKAEAKAAKPERAEAKAAKPEKAEAKAAKPEKAEAKAAKPEKAEAKPSEEAKGVKKAKAEKSEGKGKKADKGKKRDEARRAGYAPNIEEGLLAKPARLKVRYRDEVVPSLMKELGFKNPNQVPRLEKIVINMGLGEALANAKMMESAVDQLAAITGQKPVVTKARKSIANFKLRQGQSIGAAVTLRADRMYEFFDRLINVALPRVRDFKGVSTKAFDGRGNYTIGIREQIIFPEINYDTIEKVKGLNVSIVTTARNDEQGLALLKHLGMPFKQ
ncbi:MAG: 50S ribosomal protein L5 [Myxococcales bacterium]|nr:50S ribosomal protein L5 [Myxococcales bacterium]